MRLGILGGTFDPIHKGHLALAHAALSELCLDQMLFVPVLKHPFKSVNAIIASAEHRLLMTHLAVEGEPRFLVSDCEIKRGGVSYTVDTLRELSRQYPKPNELFFITGGDWGKDLNTWKDIDTILMLAQFVVASRPGFDLTKLPKRVSRLEFEPLDIAASEIRRCIKRGEIPNDWLSRSVLDYISLHRLYQD